MSCPQYKDTRFEQCRTGTEITTVQSVTITFQIKPAKKRVGRVTKNNQGGGGGSSTPPPLCHHLKCPWRNLKTIAQHLQFSGVGKTKKDTKEKLQRTKR